MAQEVTVQFTKKIGGKTEIRSIPFSDRKEADKWIQDILSLDKGQCFADFELKEKA